MNDRHTADTITDDALDALYEQLDARDAALATYTAQLQRDQAALARVRHLADRLDEFAENALKTSDRDLYAALARDIRNHTAPAATAATRPADQPKEQRERPTHPDGTPYRYHEITAEGWEHCDGCGLWGQWTVANPHECANDRVQPADQPKEQ